MKYYYFISFVFKSKEDHWEYGNYQMILETPITTMEDVEAIEQKLKEKLRRNFVVVLNWNLLKEE